jgi:amino acid adenylation domain-containing protein
LPPPTGFRLSPQQARLWSLCLAEGEAPFVARAILALEGGLDTRALEGALREVVGRHEILRTTYQALPGTSAALQVPGPVPVLLLEREDLSGLPGPEQEAKLASTAGPAFHLAALGADRHALVLATPALSADRQSLALCLREVAEAYAAQVEHRTLGSPPAQYADVAEIFNQCLEAEDTREGRRYWEEAEPQPAAAAVSGGGAFQPGRMRVPLALTGEALQAAAARAGVAWEDFVLAGWQLLLSRLSGEPGWGVAVRFDGRTYEGLEAVPGLFERYLPLRCALPGRAPFAEVARAVAQARREAAERQDYSQPGRAPRPRGVAFEAFTWPEPVRAAGVAFTATRLEACTERHELKLACTRRGGGLELELHHDRARRAPAEVARLAERLSTLLEAAAASPGRAADALPVVGPEELRLLQGLQRHERPCDTEGTFHERFDDQARRTPEAVAVVSEEEQLTYAQLASAANRLAWHLREQGVGPEARVGLLLERSAEQVVALLAILKAGGAFVPLDPMHPRGRLESILRQAGAHLVVTRSHLQPLLPSGVARPLCLDLEAGSIGRAPSSPPASGAAPDNLAYVLFTSGSTGQPKGVMITHRSLLNLAAALREQVYEGRPGGLRVSLSAPLVFDASVKQWVQLLYGDSLHVIPEEARPDAARMGALARARGLDVLDCTPSLLVPLLEQGLGREPGFSPALVLVGGEALDERTWNELRARERTRPVNLYGPTECTVDATACAVRERPAPSIGRVLANVRAHVLDGHLLPVPLGVPGELFIGGAGVGRGYVGRPGLSAERFLPDPFGPPGARLYRTGDLCRLQEDGHLEFLGRVDHQVKLRGLRIELGEIESRLRAHPEVAEAVVVVQRPAGGEARLAGYFVPRGSAAPQGLRAFLREALPEYMVPSALVALPRLPLNHNGKLDRAALPEPPQHPEGEVQDELPLDHLEEAIAAIWRQLLKLDKVGRHGNFFDLGGHSLLLVEAQGKLSAALGRRLSVVELFQHPTVAALARHISGAPSPAAGGSTASPPSVDERARRQRESFQQQALRAKAGRGKR